MAKLKNIIKQLSDSDYETIYKSLVENGAEKSAYLLRAVREKQTSDSKVMEELEVNSNAYYTLRSRLNQKIEEYLLQQMESPRTDLLKKVANINEVVFTKKRAIAIATLTKLEKELLDYDLSNELTIVYKHLKKLHIHTGEHYSYSQLYNRHIAYMLAVDKAEDMLAEYFRKFGFYSLSGEESDKMEVSLLHQELNNIAGMYQSHRLYVYQACMNIFHRLFVFDDSVNMESEAVEDMLEKCQRIFNNYNLDTTYYHLRLVFEYLRHEYYVHHRVYRKAEKYHEDVNDELSSLLVNYNLFTYPALFLFSKIDRALRLNLEAQLYDENDDIFAEYENHEYDVPRYLMYMTYRALSAHYKDKHDEAARWINTALNNVSLKKYPYASLELKTLLAFEYCLLKEQELFSQVISSVQRQLRLLGREQCDHIAYFSKIMRVTMSGSRRDKEDKIGGWIPKIKYDKQHIIFTPTRFIRFDTKIVEKLCS